ncbi:MAG TPA: GNAT family N-acetyltransferase [Acidimicrobiia bacterium]|nr:GNAT family N-acetyltransferase [Acidimicrobiia bacterium]
MAALPPDRIDLGNGTLGPGAERTFALRRLRVGDAPKVAGAVGDNLDHLRPWMPWAGKDSADTRFQRRRLAEADLQWARGADFGYGLFATADDGFERLLGAFGLTARRGPRTLEIGYWLCADVTGFGLATRAVAALTDTALAVDGIERVLVYCDEANHASAAIPRRLGFTIDRIVAVPPEAAAETGRQLEWVVRPAEWRELRSAAGRD